MTVTDKSQSELSAIQKRHSRRRKKRILMMKIRRTVFFTVLGLIVLFIVLFYTPIFNIRSVEVLGNNKVETSVIMESIGPTEGKNLFRTGTSAMKKELLKMPYIENVKIKKSALRSKLVISVTEAEDAATIAGGAGYIIIDTEAKVLAETAEKPQNIPEVTGLSISNISIGSQLKIEEKEKFDVMVACLAEMKRIGILSGVKSISVADIANITFNYEDRLDAVCGSSVDLSKKLGFFKSAVNSNRLTETSRGTIDLTTTGKAIYTP